VCQLWKQRRLIFSFAARNMRQIYAGSRLGIFASLFQPILSLLFFSVFFGLLIKLNTGEVGYLYYAFSGMILWNFFSMTFSDILTSLSKYTEVIGKMYFPRMVLPLASIANSLIIAVISFLLLIGLMLFGGYEIGPTVFLFPVFLIMILICSFPVALWLSVKTLKKRDLLFIIPGLVGFGSWLTPVFYPVTIIPEPYTQLIYINPLTIIVMLFRWSLFNIPLPDLTYLIILLIPVLLTLLSMRYFIKKDKDIADYI
jgi:lipopolysaccharide transport system permease protein